MELVEGGTLELLEAHGNQSARSFQNPIEPVSKADIQAVGEQMAASKFPCVANKFVEGESDCCIEGRDNCAGARADDDVDGNVVGDKLLKDPDVTCAAQASAA